jgi:hypothetical protein
MWHSLSGLTFLIKMGTVIPISSGSPHTSDKMMGAKALGKWHSFVHPFY